MKNPLRNDLPKLKPRDFFYLLDIDFDIDAQLLAIRQLLARHRQADNLLTQKIKQREAYVRKVRGTNHYAVEDWVDHMHASVYQDAVHSMAAVGMLAPFMESIFDQCFRAISKLIPNPPPNDHVRWKRFQDIQWDCRKVVIKNGIQNDIVRGVLQLSDAINLTLPKKLPKILSALFAYRNKMFHHGFEWPAKERNKFVKRIDEEKWPKRWFLKSTSGGNTWIIYLSPVFIDNCLSMVDQVLDAVGKFLRNLKTQKVIHIEGNGMFTITRST